MQGSVARTALAGSALAVLAAVVACGGGGGGAGSSVPGTSTQGQATFTVSVPSGASASAVKRVPAFVSPNAQSITIAVAGTTTTANLTPTSAGCTAATATTPLTCTISLYAPPGNDTFVVNLYGGLNGGGSLLASSTVSATVSASQPTTVPVTLGGVVASIGVSIPNGNDVVPGGYATSLAVNVQAKDPSGATIVGAGLYTNPITLTNADTSGITTLSTTTVTSPTTTVTLTYAPNNTNSGVLAVSGLPVGATTIGASAGGVPASAVTPGTFQYIADRFFGFNHSRTLTGTGTVVNTTYNGLGTPSPNPSMWAYNISEPSVTLAGATFNGSTYIDNQFTEVYTQTSPLPAPSPESQTLDRYRNHAVTPTGTTDYEYATVNVDSNYGAINSPVTGFVPGTTTLTTTFGSPYQIDVLPHAAATWINQTVPFTQAWAGAEVATWNYPGDGSYTFSESVPTTMTQAETVAGAATNFNGSNGILTTISPPSGSFIPVARATTSPSPGPTSTYSAANWYPNGVVASPLLTDSWQLEYMTSIPTGPGYCAGLAPALASQPAWVEIETRTELRIPIFQLRQQVYAEAFIPGGVGIVCALYAGQFTSYNTLTGIISSSQTQQTSIVVTSTSGLSIKR